MNRLMIKWSSYLLRCHQQTSIAYHSSRSCCYSSGSISSSSSYHSTQVFNSHHLTTITNRYLGRPYSYSTINHSNNNNTHNNNNNNNNNHNKNDPNFKDRVVSNSIGVKHDLSNRHDKKTGRNTSKGRKKKVLERDTKEFWKSFRPPPSSITKDRVPSSPSPSSSSSSFSSPSTFYNDLKLKSPSLFGSYDDDFYQPTLHLPPHRPKQQQQLKQQDNEINEFREMNETREKTQITEQHAKNIQFQFNRFLLKSIPSLSNPDSTLVVAVSGGSDSMALLYLLVDFIKSRNNATPNQKTQLVIVTIDHGLTPPSEDVELITQYINHVINSFADRSSTSNDIIHLVKKLDWGESGQPQTSVQEICRYRRLDLLEEVAKQYNSNAILMGTNKDDNIETFVHRIQFASGVEGLASIESMVPMTPTISLYRPLLLFSKDSLFGLCNHYGISFNHDIANDNLDYDRNRIRYILNKRVNNNNDNNNNNSQQQQQVQLEHHNLINEINNVISIFKHHRQDIRSRVENLTIDFIQNYSDQRLPMIRIPWDQIVSLPLAIGSRVLHQLTIYMTSRWNRFQHSKYHSFYREFQMVDPKDNKRIFARNIKDLIFYKDNDQLIIHYAPPKSAQSNCTLIKDYHLYAQTPIIFDRFTIVFTYYHKSKHNNNNNHHNNKNNNNSNKQLIVDFKPFAVRYYRDTDSQITSSHLRSLLQLPKYGHLITPVIVNQYDQAISALLPQTGQSLIAFAPRYLHSKEEVPDYNVTITHFQ